MIDSSADLTMRAEPCPNCAVCGDPGRTIHTGLSDRLFSAKGVWSMKTCANPSCGVVWPDPMPVAEEIWKAYTSYYTHTVRPARKPQMFLRRFFEELGHDYQIRRFGYDKLKQPKYPRGFLALLRLFPITRRGLEVEMRYLERVTGGRVLDVGCGSGDWLISMRSFGWEVHGLDFDPKAVAAANNLGLHVDCGALEQQNYPPRSFDAITLSHVIEHVPSPRATIAECFRILRPGGKLVIVTPNERSLGHKVFKQDWRGLEPPRHLHVFSPLSLRRLILSDHPQAEVSVHVQIVRSIIYESILLQLTDCISPPTSRLARILVRACSFCFNLGEIPLVALKPSLADCMAVVAVKDARDG
jgi:2-polyprenyl-3-methyl-5-hydroxy-6-metoxy-1,4-benzoquinol methylase